MFNRYSYGEKMEIRSDLQSEEVLLNRILQYADVFATNDRVEWPHLKHNEDFKQVYRLSFELKRPIETIYEDGRNLAIFMAGRLREFNNSKAFPTLKAFVDSFAGGWVDQIEILKTVSQDAKSTVLKLESPPWAVSKMIQLFDEQIDLLKATRQVIEGLKQSQTYYWEESSTPARIHSTQYEKILECINLIGKMFERLPSTYANKEEEHLRDHILVTLGAAVNGSATGETFNKRGKTDILVRSSKRGDNEFVGECKFWAGEAGYHKTIDQVLSYLTWRDNKGAVIFFVPNKGFSSVLQKLRDETPRHPQFLRFESSPDDSWLNYIFTMAGDTEREIQLAIMAYHIPAIF